MPGLKSNKSKINQKESDRYRMVVMKADTLQEIRSFDLTPGSLYIMASVIIVLLISLLVLMLVFTPIKKLIPGYGDIQSTPEFLELVTSVNEIEKSIEAQEIYIQALSNLIGNNLTNDSNFENYEVLGANSNPVTVERNSLSDNLSSPTLNSIDDKYKVFWTSLADKRLYQPVEGIINSQFDPSIKHYGVDILAPAKTPIVTIMDGFVFSSGWDLETGYTIGIQHEGNFLSFYKHNSQLLKEKGTFVQAGEAVAIIGNTGTLSTGPHLHFELWHNGKPINPTDIIKFD